MGDFDELNPHVAEEIKFNLEKLHEKLEVDPRCFDILKIIITAGERLKAKVGRIEYLEEGKEGVTEEDLRIEQELGALIDSFQDGSVLFSEEERTETPPDDAKDVWICDPISNTKSLREGRPGYAITMAHRAGKETDFSVVYDVGRGRLYTAYQGKGAYINGIKIQIPEITTDPPRVSINKANAALFEKFGDSLVKNGKFGKVKGEPQSVALNTLEILHGNRDGGVILPKDFFPHPASQLVVEEAGGTFTNINGDNHLDPSDEIFVFGATKELHAQILEFVQGLAQEKGIPY